MKRGEGVWIIFSTWWALGGGREGGVLDFFFQTCGLLGVDGSTFSFSFKNNGTLGLDWGMEGRVFYGSFMGVRVLELGYKTHLGSISLSFSNAKPQHLF